MSVFNKPFPFKPKIASKHPWDHRIRNEYISSYKHGHNSVYNPAYIPLDKKKPKDVGKGDKSRVKFIVIGNRVSKEFIYCLHVVSALHTYRKKLYDPPIIRGVTSVEWPKVLRDLKMQYRDLAYCLKSQVAVLMNGKIIGGENELKEYLDDRYDYRAPLYLDYFKEGIQQFADYVYSYGRPCVYMHISIDDVPIGPLIFMLYSDIVPLTCQNFIRLCSTKRGGYPGTPIHRIVKDGWIQGGGYGLKGPIKLNCENFIVPHDRRGVLCMANSGRHEDCSTQFFVILESSTWMEHKYVAFGQLIEGEETLKKIENVPTWYESPTSKIIIYKTGVFNMDCKWVSINKSTHEYYDLHIEDVNYIKETYYEELMEKVFYLIKLRAFLRSEFVSPLIAKVISLIPEPEPVKVKGSKKTPTDTRGPSTMSLTVSTGNEDFDVEVYEYEIGGEELGGGEGEYGQGEVEMSPQPSSVPRPKDIYFWPLTDVPYPGEIESTFDLKRLLRGDYCHECDLESDRPKEPQKRDKAPKDLPVPEDVYEALHSVYADDESQNSIDSEDDEDIKEYIREFADTASFAGPVVKKITQFSRRFAHLTGETAKKCVYSDEDLRFIRSAAKTAHQNEHKKVVVTSATKICNKIIRRPTGFVRPADLARVEAMEKAHEEDSSDSEDDKKKEQERVLIIDADRGDSRRSSRDVETHRKVSCLERLFDDVSLKSDEDIPTLKKYKPLGELHQDKNYTYLTHSPLAFHSRSQNKLSYRPPLEDFRVTDTLAIQHGKKVSRKISSDYANTINQFERVTEYSIRTIEFARQRPAMTVMEYKKRNQKHQAEMQESKERISSNVSFPTNMPKSLMPHFIQSCNVLIQKM